MRTLAWFLGLILLGLAAIALFSYPAWLLLHPHFGFPFHRIGERIGMLALALGFWPMARRLHLNDRASLGYGLPRREFLRQAALGLGLGVATMAAVVALMSALGLLDWRAAAHMRASALAGLLAARLLSGLAVAVIEETFLRGAMHTGIERESGPRLAVFATAAVYAATHFFASYRIAAPDVGAGSGLDLLAGTLHLFAAPGRIADAFLCLFAVGVVLGAVRAATGNIAACIGLHAGWVWVMLTVHGLAAPVPSNPLAFLLSGFDGFIGWLVLAWTIVVGLGLRRLYASDSGSTARTDTKGASTSSR
jgi:membrane protease YdiL (CAAX protease family)